MRTLFADAGYWIALKNPRDSLHNTANAVTLRLGRFRIVTSQMVLVEFLNFMSGRGRPLREKAVSTATNLMTDPNVLVIPQSYALYESAIELYASRLDKDWGLTDCASFTVMREMKIPEALAHDHAFEQAGFAALLRSDMNN